MRLILALLLLFPMLSAAVERDLDDCTIGATPTAEAPLDLDNCTINDGDEITGIMTGLASTYGAVYVRAPSRTLTVVSDYISFNIDQFRFFEDQSARNTLLIQHKVITTNTPGFWTMWRFNDFDTVVIGGLNLSMTFRGNHPGLANCSSWPNWSSGSICDQNQGLIEFRMTGGATQATLADVRANIRFSQHYAIYTWGKAGYGSNGAPGYINQLNVAGVMYATSGIFFHQGVRNAWADPDRTVVTDPYLRSFGWDGTTRPQTEGGLTVGCGSGNNGPHRQYRYSSFSGYYVENITGGITCEYGTCNSVQRYVQRMGTASSPFIVRVKDWLVSGPGTPYPAGVRVKQNIEYILFKGDPHDTPDTGSPLRFIRIVKLPDTYGSGPAVSAISGCTYNNNYADARSNFFRLENSTTGLNRDWDVTFSGDFNTNFIRGTLFYFAYDGSRSYRHTFRASSQTTITDTIQLVDTNTVTGPGTFTNLLVADIAGASTAQANTVTNTNVAGVVTVSASTGTTTISNVNFTGSARAVVTIGAGSTVVADDFCVPNGSTITGTGSLTYEGGSQSLPYTIPNGTANCAVTANARPDAPGVP